MTHGTKNLLNCTTGNAEEERGEANAAVDRLADRSGQYSCLCKPLVLGGAPCSQRQKEHCGQGAGQLTSFRRRAEGAPCDKEFTQVLRRSESIYYQAVHNYNRTFSRPWVYLPARLMGFRRAPEQPADANIH